MLSRSHDRTIPNFLVMMQAKCFLAHDNHLPGAVVTEDTLEASSYERPRHHVKKQENEDKEPDFDSTAGNAFSSLTWVL